MYAVYSLKQLKIWKHHFAVCEETIRNDLVLPFSSDPNNTSFDTYRGIWIPRHTVQIWSDSRSGAIGFRKHSAIISV